MKGENLFYIFKIDVIYIMYSQIFSDKYNSSILDLIYLIDCY